jgi:hypothetical protein|tara:strand:- start:619 stop:837 length:219 start_codon:yes stop_codon:yes gene_type:complete
MSRNELEKKGKVSYGYFIDEEGLFYYSEMNGEVYEMFSINGVSSMTLNDNYDFKILELSYIYTDELDNREET